MHLYRRFAAGPYIVGILASAAGLIAQANAAGVDERPLAVPPNLPNLICDSAGTTGFVTNAKNNVEAVDLKTGTTLWESTDACRPLAVAGKKLIAQAGANDKPNSIRLVLLDLESGGKLLKQSAPLEMPQQTVFDQNNSSHGGAAPGQQLSETFSITATIEKNAALVTWRSSLVASGRTNSSRHCWGSFRLDLDSGEAKLLTKGSVGNAKSPDLIEPIKDPPKGSIEGDPDPQAAPVPPENLRRLVGPPDGNSQPRIWDKPWIVDGKGCLLLIKPSKDNPNSTAEFFLHHWDIASGKSADPILLHQGQHPFVLHRSADGATIILALNDKETQRVRLIAAAAGKQLADVDLKGRGLVQLLPDGKTVLIARASESDKNVQHVTLLAAASGEKLGELDVKCGKELKIEQVVGIVGTRVYSAELIEARDGKGGGGIQTHGTTTLTAYDAARGESVWKKSFSARTSQFTGLEP